ncbi:MAG: phage tail sheath family protein, partial [Spirochaetales bacterium]|nr:phage tail sheath family protein [Spirochaetales bacterium]
KTSYVKDIPFVEVMKAVEQPTDPEELEIWEEAMALITPAKEPVDAVEPVDPDEEDPQSDAPVLNSQHMLPEDTDADADADAVEEPKKEAAPERDYEKELKITSIIPRVPGYAKTLAALQEEACVIPPSGAMAGIFAATDRRVGVWQAPANVGVASIKGLSQLLTDNQQDKMNVDPSTSKSINAIRYFKGKGYLVWGSRTLNAGSNEWRYVPVRRLFNYVEQSVKLSTYWAVFQPNDSNTWTKIKCQISNFLNTLWRDGALAGATPEEAYFVEVGKDITMTAEDIYNGYLIVRIGLAAVRPAEFIVLEFSHKVQE